MRIDNVIVTWDVQWDLPSYLERYVRTRRMEPEGAHEELLACLERYPAGPPFRKADLDYFLDANLGKRGQRA